MLVTYIKKALDFYDDSNYNIGNKAYNEVVEEILGGKIEDKATFIETIQDMRIAKETQEYMYDNKDLLANVPKERIRDELSKLMVAYRADFYIKKYYLSKI